jgi:translocation and assembly module TamA
VSATWIHALPWSGGKFIGHTEQGATIADNFNKLPTTYRFYAGGISSVRGYGYKELGPKDAQGNVIGGQFLSVLGAEYEHSIFDDWGIAAFIDTGNAYNIDNIRLKTGAGVGARWYSPFGPVRVDFAIPLDPADSSFQIHFSAGGRL